jgi:hypothetical protein
MRRRNPKIPVRVTNTIEQLERIAAALEALVKAVEKLDPHPPEHDNDEGDE